MRLLVLSLFVLVFFEAGCTHSEKKLETKSVKRNVATSNHEVTGVENFYRAVFGFEDDVEKAEPLTEKNEYKYKKWFAGSANPCLKHGGKIECTFTSISLGTNSKALYKELNVKPVSEKRNSRKGWSKRAGPVTCYELSSVPATRTDPVYNCEITLNSEDH